MICGLRHKKKFKYPYSRDSKIIQTPYPQAKAIDQIQALCPELQRIRLKYCYTDGQACKQNKHTGLFTTPAVT